MFYVIGSIPIIILFTGGVFAIIRFLIRDKPDKEKFLDKLAAYKTFVGIALLLWGIVSLIGFLRVIRFIPMSIERIPVTTVSSLISTVISITLGIVLSINYLRTTKDTPVKVIHTLNKKVYPVQTILGFIAIADAIVLLISSLGKF
jgi:hypothetical protein